MATAEDVKAMMLDAVADARAAAGGRLSHVDDQGAARMVDVGDKAVTTRIARAGARIWMASHTMDLLVRQALPKGDVLAVARVAGIMAAKKTSELVPLCHPLALSNVELSFVVDAEGCRIDIECLARTEGRTGVEMEALTGASVAAITIYDMAKAVDREMVIGDLRLLEKSGGKEHYVRDESRVRTECAPDDGVRRRRHERRFRGSRRAPSGRRALGQRQPGQRGAQEGRPAGGPRRRPRHRGRRARGALAPPGEPARAGVHRQDGREGA